jgi:hypothetical protein
MGPRQRRPELRSGPAIPQSAGVIGARMGPFVREMGLIRGTPKQARR